MSLHRTTTRVSSERAPSHEGDERLAAARLGGCPPLDQIEAAVPDAVEDLLGQLELRA
jgi:hypothetical protein